MDGIYDCISMKVFSYFLLVKQKKDYLDYSSLQLKLLAIPSAPLYHHFRDTYCSVQCFLFAVLFSSLEEFVSLCIIFIYSLAMQCLTFDKRVVILNVYMDFKEDMDFKEVCC